MKKKQLKIRVSVLETAMVYRNDKIISLNDDNYALRTALETAIEARIEVSEIAESALEDRAIMEQKIDEYSDSLKLYEDMQDNLIHNLRDMPDLLDLIETLQMDKLTA